MQFDASEEQINKQNSIRCRFMNKLYKVLFISLVLELVLFYL